MNRACFGVLFLVLLSARGFSQADERGPGGVFESVLQGRTGIADVRAKIDRQMPGTAGTLDEIKLLYFKGIMETYLPGGQGGKQLFEQGLERVEELDPGALERRERSEYYRLYADLLNRVIIDMNPLKAMAASSRIKRYALRALELDPKNIRAEITLIAYTYNAPKIAGGDRAYARERVKQLLSEKREDTQIEYLLNLWLLIICRDSGDEKGVEQAESALEMLYPPNEFLTGFLETHLA